MNYKSSNSSGEGNWNENLREGLKGETFLKILMIFPLFVNLTYTSLKKANKWNCIYIK